MRFYNQASGGVDNGDVDELVDALFITKKNSEVGAYQLRLWLNGQWETVTIDDFFPVLSNDNRDLPCAGAAGAYSLHFREIWVALVEKAVAKYYVSAFSSLTMCLVWRSLTCCCLFV